MRLSLCMIARLILSAHRTGKVVNLSSSGYILSDTVRECDAASFLRRTDLWSFFSSPPPHPSPLYDKRGGA